MNAGEHPSIHRFRTWSWRLRTGDLEPERFIPILDALRALLPKYDFIEDATFVAELIDLSHLDSPEFAKRLQSGQVWGNGLGRRGLHGQRGRAGGGTPQRRRAIHVPLVRFADEMKAQGISYERSELIADAIREGLKRLRARGECVPPFDEGPTA